MNDDRRIVLGEDDFNEPATPSSAPGPSESIPPVGGAVGTAEAPKLPPVSRREPLQVGGDSPSPSFAQSPQLGGSNVGILANPRTAPIIAAVGSMAVAWGLAELLDVYSWGSSWTGELGLAASSGLSFAIVGMIFGSTMLSYDRFFAGAHEEALRRFAIAAGPMFGIAFVAGFLAQLLFSALLNDDFGGSGEAQYYLARTLGWSLFGLGIGVAEGLLTRSSKRAINGAIGGAAGGALGGFLFEAGAQVLTTSGSASRMFGLLSIAILIAVFTRVVEQARREAWLSVVYGGMSGKEFIVYHRQTRIGASPECEIYLLKDPAVAKVHGWIDDLGAERILNVTDGNVIFVNGSPITRHTLRHGNQIQIGGTVILYSERALAPNPHAYA